MKLHVGGILVGFLEDLLQAILCAGAVGEQPGLVTGWVRYGPLIEGSKGWNKSAMNSYYGDCIFCSILAIFKNLFVKSRVLMYLRKIF